MVEVMSDPLGIDGGVNVYAMANLNPLAFVDPYGLEAMTSGARAGEKLRGALNRSVEFTQNALKSIGHAAWEGIAWTAPRVWNLPNTTLGLAWGGLGYVAGALPGVQMPKASFGHNAVQFEGHPLMPDNTGITLGNAISYAGNAGDWVPTYDGASRVQIGYHEEWHTYQSQMLGPFFLPTYFLLGGISANNPYEQDADNYARGRR